MPNLEKYRAKRDPAQTPEPFGALDGRAPGRPLAADAQRRFIVQQHAARRMHWDLRLEIDGVLVSFAVPKGPTSNRDERRLAVRTEDHPLEYADFEGTIPEGNYGAGAMIVWDDGNYRSIDGNSPAQGLAAGKLDLTLNGHKLRGRFALVRTKSEDGRQWLLLAKRATPAGDSEAELIEALPASVLSGLRVDEVAAAAADGCDERITERLARLGLPGAAKPDAARHELSDKQLEPMLAATSDDAFSRDGWIFELKYDGVRTIAVKRDREVRLLSRRGRDVTGKYPEIAHAIAHLPLSQCVIDGEIVAPDDAGKPSFEAIQRRFTQTDPDEIARARVEYPTIYYAFDLLSALGRDLRARPLVERKALLESFAPKLGFVRFADHVERDGEALFGIAQRNGLEGIVGKRADSKYQSGRRSPLWQKMKVPRSAHFAIVGLRSGKGSRRALGSLLLAGHDGHEWRYVGNAGSGLGEALIDELLGQSDALHSETATCSGLPERLPRGVVHWRPELACRVGFTEFTSGGMLRHPVLLDVDGAASPERCALSGPTTVDPEEDAALEDSPTLAETPGVPEFTRLDKVFWPIDGYTKGDLLAYYEDIWPWLAPYLRDRPVVLTRYPDGIEGKSFYQKNAPDFTPEWATRANVEGTDYFICNELRTLLYVINSGAIPLHVWSARIDDLDHPDWCILDLDPKQASFENVVVLARHIHALLDDIACPHFAKTSGQDGMHILIPLERQLDHEQSKRFAEVLARTVCAERPDIATIVRSVAARGDKIYVDYLQNGRGKLIASQLSVRPRTGAPVSMPLRFTQLNKRLRPERWTIRNAARELAKHGDPMSGVLGTGAAVESALEALGERLARAARGRSST